MRRMLITAILIQFSYGVRMIPIKSNAAIPRPSQTSYISRKDTHVVPLSGCVSVVFHAPITIGTQSFSMLVDTGSSTTAVAGASCATCGGSDPTYVPGAAAQNQHQVVTAVYGSGSWTGGTYSDEVSFAGFATTRLIFGVVDSSSTFFIKAFCQHAFNQPNTYQGILGLAYPSLAVGNTQAYPSVVGLGVFAIQMCLNSGRLWLDGFDTSYLNTSALQYTPIVQQKWYVLTLTDVSVDSTSIGSFSYGTVVVDSGTSLFVLPTAAYSALVTSLLSDPTVSPYFSRAFFDGDDPCVRHASLPDPLPAFPTIELALTGARLVLPAIQSYLIKQYGPDGTLYYCSGLEDAGSFGDFTILGYAVMNNFVVIFDRTNAQIGFAPGYFCDSNGPDTNTTDWFAGTWSDCTNCTRTRAVDCVDNHGTTVNVTLCSDLPKPATTEPCCSDTRSLPTLVIFMGLGLTMAFTALLFLLCN